MKKIIAVVVLILILSGVFYLNSTVHIEVETVNEEYLKNFNGDVNVLFKENKANKSTLFCEVDLLDHDLYFLNQYEEIQNSWKLVSATGHTLFDLSGHGSDDFATRHTYEFSSQWIINQNKQRMGVWGFINNPEIKSIKINNGSKTTVANEIILEDGLRVYYLEMPEAIDLRSIEIITSDENVIFFANEDELSQVNFHYNTSKLEYDIEEPVYYAVLGDLPFVSKGNVTFETITIDQLTETYLSNFDAVFVKDGIKLPNDILNTDYLIYYVKPAVDNEPLFVQKNNYSSSTYNRFSSIELELNYFEIIEMISKKALEN